MPRWFKHRFGMHARRVTVRPRMPLHLRVLAIVFFVVSVGCLGWIASRQGDSLAGAHATQDRTTDPLPRSAEPEAGLASLRSEVAVLERQLQIERASAADLARQVKQLASENAQLKEQVALVQTISAAGPRNEGVQVSTARIEASALPGEYSYRIVLLQTGSRTRAFQGHYQLVVNLLENGRRRGLTLPGPGEGPDSPYRLDFRVHQRIDGTFRIDPGAAVRDVELRVFEGRQARPRLTQTIAVS